MLLSLRFVVSVARIVSFYFAEIGVWFGNMIVNTKMWP